MGILALLGNGLALFYRLKFDAKCLHLAYTIFVANLTIADFLMGIYLITIAIADQYYRNRYNLKLKMLFTNYHSPTSLKIL